ncbi:hypothetical protein QUF64_03850 [Anaerolineales bacterium HSG6]|nr:hypothetical protein [Anaerolineales bacterium HSG6]MDM8531624.1 hypothetical protein [Anaerolineales bacterium HSG25]
MPECRYRASTDLYRHISLSSTRRTAPTKKAAPKHGRGFLTRRTSSAVNIQ